MDVFAAAAPAPDLGRAIRYDFIGVHVRRRARAGLEHIDDEVIVVAALRDLLGGPAYRGGLARLQQAETFVDQGGGGLDQTERRYESTPEAPAADRKVEDGALGRGAVERLIMHLHLAHGVLFDPHNPALRSLGCLRPTLPGRRGHGTRAAAPGTPCAPRSAGALRRRLKYPACLGSRCRRTLRLGCIRACSGRLQKFHTADDISEQGSTGFDSRRRETRMKPLQRPGKTPLRQRTDRAS